MTQTSIPNSNQIATKNNFFTNAWFIYFQGIYKAIRAKFQLNLSGILSVDTDSVSNSNAGETDLITYDLAGKTLANDGDILTIQASGIFAVNGNNKTLKLKFGSQTIVNTGAVAANGTNWEINATIIRKSPTTQEISTRIISNNSASVTRTAGTQNLTAAITIKCTGLGSSSDDITQEALVIGLTPND
ncbi:MAG: hypothetical protein VKL60_18090 [Sphaerospermopsis sp.]|nr:hypothetical protein [Sphaerospermopsis sp.]